MGGDDFNLHFVHVNHYCGTTINVACSGPRMYDAILAVKGMAGMFT